MRVIPFVPSRSDSPRATAQAPLAPARRLSAAGGALAVAMASGPALAHVPGSSDSASLAQAPVWLALALLVLAWLAYAWGAVRKRPAPGPCLAFHSAMGIAALALFGPLDTLAESSAAWHMGQHMLLIAVVAPLAVLARPLPQWRAAVGMFVGAPADALWRHLHRFSRHPMRCALLHAAAIWFWHAPGPYIAALQSPGWHVLEHACFLFSGWLFWWAVLRPSRAGVLPAAVALLFTVMHTGLLGALLSFASVPLYHQGPGALADQQLAGLLMWIPGGLLYLLAAAWAAGGWLQTLEARAASPSKVPARRPTSSATAAH